jgi:hypothetical protein
MEEIVNLGMKPRGIPKLHGHHKVPRQGGEERFESWGVSPPSGGKLDQNGAHVVGEDTNALNEEVQGLLYFSEFFSVGDDPAQLDGEKKSLRGLGCPVSDGRLGGESIESGVDLYTGKPLGVI